MCGIFGYYLNRPLNSVDIENGKSAIAKLEHRGPNNLDYWHNKSKGIFLGHTRLSVQDISSKNNQPYLSPNFKLVFNGEIYNFLEIRKELEKYGHVFSTNGDTEVFAKSFQKYGESALDVFDGMFAFSFFSDDRLTLGVDVFGEKPLYWHHSDDGFYFSSEPKPLVDLLNLKVDLNQEKINQFLMLGYIASPNTIYNGLYRCEPATIINVSPDRLFSKRKYWHKPEQFIDKGKVGKTTELELDSIEESLSLSLSRRVISDVPIGLFLSSGVDSSLIAALLRKNHHNHDLLSLTVSYGKNGVSEEENARKIANYLNIEHIIVDSDKAKNEYSLELLDSIFNEPNSGLTAFSVYQMSQLAKPYFTVALSGLGGDEVFYGYGKHHFLYKNRNILTSRFLMRLLGRIGSLSNKYFQKMKTIDYLSSVNCNEVLFALKNQPYYNNTCWNNNFSNIARKYFKDVNSKNIVTQTRDFDMDINLPNIIIPSIERASMRHGIEARTPFLSKDVLDVVSNIDYRKFVKFGQKDVLRKILSRHIPKKLFNHPKQGFVFPNSKLLENSRQNIDALNKSDELFRIAVNEGKGDDRWNNLILRYLIIDFYKNKS